jgi:23S rRNA (uridine2552-2'-O)-methyltransferase
MKKNRWDDHFARRARNEKWLARSVYKLEEMDRKYRLMRSGDRLLDLGCYPGSWSQYGLSKVGPRGEVVGVDLTRPDRLSDPCFRFVQGDVFTLDEKRLLEDVGPRDLVMSDLAPKTTGAVTTDATRSMDLAARAWEIALALLKKKGHFVCKVFEGEDLKAFRTRTSKHFLRVRLFRPSAVRKGSREIYVVGIGFSE